MQTSRESDEVEKLFRAENSVAILPCRHDRYDWDMKQWHKATGQTEKRNGSGDEGQKASSELQRRLM